MSEQPPQFDTGGPSPDYSGYYIRPDLIPSLHADKLQALANGYFGLNLVFVLNIVLALGLNALVGLSRSGEIAFLALVGGAVFVFLVIAGCTFPYNRKIAFGMGWAPGIAVLASLLMGLNSALCCGIIGYVVMQQIAFVEIKKYGVRKGFFGVRKGDVAARISELRQAELRQRMPSAPPPL